MDCFMCGKNTIPRSLKNLEGHPFRNVFRDDQFRECEFCRATFHPCCGCNDVLVDLWSPDSREIWDDILQCEECNKVFCQSCWCSKGKVGDDDDYLCDSCLNI